VTAPLERLEDAEDRCDAVMNDPASTSAQKCAAITRLYRRAYRNLAEAERAVACYQGGVMSNADTLRSLADAVLDLADGMGGDDQEQDRAGDIAEALNRIADGYYVKPLPEHEAARTAWESA
jgi:hypothetical protein